MPTLKVFVDMDNKFKEIFPNGDPSTIANAELKAIGTLEAGMSSGKPSVMMMVELGDGTIIAVETSLKNFQMASAAFIAKFGDVTDGQFAITIGPKGLTVES